MDNGSISRLGRACMWRVKPGEEAHLLLGAVTHLCGLLDQVVLFIAVVRVATMLPDIILNQAHS